MEKIKEACQRNAGVLRFAGGALLAFGILAMLMGANLGVVGLLVGGVLFVVGAASARVDQTNESGVQAAAPEGQGLAGPTLMSPAVPDLQFARRERVTHAAGKGCLVQGVGIAAPFVLGLLLGELGAAVGVVVLLVLLVAGSNMSITWRCGACRNPIAGKDVRVCPVCGSQLR